MAEQHDDQAPNVEVGFKELEIVAYVGDFKLVGFAHVGVGQRVSSRRSSDYIRAFSDPRVTLSRVSIHDRGTQELIETTPFVLLNMDKVDFLYAREQEHDEED